MPNRTLWVLLVLFGLAASSFGQGVDPGARDTLYLESVDTDAGQQIALDINFFNDEELGAMTIPIGWNADTSVLICDSLSFVGSRVDYIGVKPVTIDTAGQTVLAGAVVFFEAYIPPGNGLFATLHFTIKPGAADQFIDLDTVFISPASVNFVNADASVFIPEFIAGQIKIGDPPLNPEIGFSPSSFLFEGTIGFPDPDTEPLNISNLGGGTLNWTISTSSGWLSASPASGTAPSVTAIAADISGLSPGAYEDTLVITAPGATNSPQKVPVTFIVSQLPPVIAVNPTGFSYTIVQGDPSPADEYLEIFTTAQGSELNWTASNNAAWLTISPASGTATGSEVDSVLVQVDVTGLSFGTYTDTITVSDPAADNDPVRVIVTLQIVSDLPVIQLSTDTLYVAGEFGEPIDPKGFFVLNDGEGTLTYEVTEASPYITSILNATGSAPEEVVLSFGGNPPVGEYDIPVTVTSPEAVNSPQELIVHLYISNNPAVLGLSPATIGFVYYECWQGPNYQPAVRTMQITNSGGENMDWYVEFTSDWAMFSDTTGTNDAIVEIRLDPAAVAVLPIGVYVDTIYVKSNFAIGSPESIPVTLNLLAGFNPTLVVADDTVDIPSQEVFGTFLNLVSITQVYNQNPGCLDYYIEEDIDWLTVLDSVGSAPQILDVTVDMDGIFFGVYHDSLKVFADGAAGSPKTVYVNLLVWRLHGDANWDNAITVADVVYLINYVFRDGADPQPERFTGDVNCDKFINVADIVYLVNYIFNFGDEPCGNP